MAFRFEYYENLINKHHIKNCEWQQSAKWAWKDCMNDKNGTIASVKMIDDNTVEIVKRNPAPNLFKRNFRHFNFRLGRDSAAEYTRVTINRLENTVSVDRMDKNWWISGPFLGQRDLFYVDNRDGIMAGEKSRLSFVRHNYWYHKFYKIPTGLWSYMASSSYGRAFKR